MKSAAKLISHWGIFLVRPATVNWKVRLESKTLRRLFPKCPSKGHPNVDKVDRPEDAYGKDAEEVQIGRDHDERRNSEEDTGQNDGHVVKGDQKVLKRVCPTKYAINVNTDDVHL